MRASLARTPGFVVLLLAAALAGGPARAALGPPAPGARPAVPGIVLVKLREPLRLAGKATGLAALDAVLAQHGVTGIAPVLPAARSPRGPAGASLARVAVVRYAGGAPPEVVAARLARLPGVEYAEPQWIYEISVQPNDPNYSSQRTYLERMRFHQAWDVTKGEQREVVVALVDGGTDWRHADLTANVWTNPGEVAGNGLDDDGNGYVDDVHGWNFGNDTSDPTGFLPDNGTHGTHTAGIVCAATNNATGVAGASWNSKFMPVCVSSPTTDRSIAFGYQGIVYAADNGADIVNCSWGGLGSPSLFEQEVVDYAWALGTAVVAAAGNNNSSQPHYPSSYRHVLSVANVTNFDVRVSDSNYGTTIDVCAQGQNITSTIPGGYAVATGTSMSSPHAAAVCALVKTRWPGYTADQVLERVRITADNIDAVNPSRAGLLGRGRVNAFAALTKNTPAVRITGVELAETDGDGVVEPGETVTLTLTATNFLAACTGLSFTLRETSSHAAATDSVAALGSLDSLQSVVLPPLRLAIAPTAPVQHVVGCIVAIGAAAPAYTDKDRLEVLVQPNFVTHAANHVVTSVTSVGKLGFGVSAGGTGTDGVGFRYKTSRNLLFEGALLMGTSSARISDAARGVNPLVADDDFATVPLGTPRLLAGSPWATEQSVATFNDSLAPSPLPVRVRQDAYVYADPVHDDYIILRYAIRNRGAAALTGLHVGWFCDWDLDGTTFDTNKTGLDATRDLGYVYDTAGELPFHVGIRVLGDPGITSYRGIWNDQAQAPDWGVYDDFTDTEKWECLTGGVQHPVAGPADVSQAIATGPFTVAPGDSIVVGFAILGGDDLAGLQGNADAAALKWQHLHSGTPVVIQDLTAAVDGGDVLVRWRTAAEAGVAGFRIFRARDGDPFAALAGDVELQPERMYSFRDPAPEAGTYEYRVAEVGTDGAVRLLAGVRVEVQGAAPPARAFLDPPSPNPFNPMTMLRFGVPRSGPVTLEIFDARGAQVRTLLREVRLSAGIQRVAWDGRDDSGRPVASGVYLARLLAGGTVLHRRLALVK
jgi:hypothetical protein